MLAFAAPTPLVRTPCAHRPAPVVPRRTLAATAAPPGPKHAARSLSDAPVPPFSDTLQRNGLPPLTRRSIDTLQINIGLTCNLACRHCHVESSPSRAETMERAVADRVLAVAANTPGLRVADITGGAPEMHAQFAYLVPRLRALGLSVIDRCNLAIVYERPHLAPFLAAHGVKVVASLPCYSQRNVDRQRGGGVFNRSIETLQLLNSHGYGKESHLQLDLVYNPVGAVLPPEQDALEADYKQRLYEDFGIVFNNLVCITNMPIKRFADDLNTQPTGLHDYMHLLHTSFNTQTVPGVMCTSMAHVAWDGSLNDCDFNYALDMPLTHAAGPSNAPQRLTVFDIESFDELLDRPIRTAKHCYGCTAGSGSSCGGSLT